MAGGVFSKGGFSPTLVSSFWYAADDVAVSNPATLVDRIAGALASPIGASGGTLENTGWGGQQKSIVSDNQGWQSSAASVIAPFNGGVNWWLCMVGMMLPVSSGARVMPNQTLFSAGLSSDAQKYMALQERQSIGSQRWIQRFGAAAETQDDSSTTLQGPFPYIWLLQCSSAGLKSFDLNGYSEQSFTRATGGALGVDKVLFGGLIQGGSLTADGRWRWRHLMGGAGNLSAGNVTNLLSWINNDSRGFNKYKGIVGNWCTKTNVLSGGAQQSNGQGQGTPATAVTAANAYVFGLNSFVTSLVDPWTSSTGTPFSTLWTTSGIGSAMPAFANQMEALGKYNPATESLVCIPSGQGGSSMGSFWVTGVSTSPPAWDAPVGAVCLRLEHIFKNFPNPVLGIVDWYQGESETLSLVQANAWGAINRAQAVRTAINNFIAARGMAVTSGFRHTISVLPTTNWTSAAPANWLALRTSQLNFASSFSDCVSLQVADGPWTDATLLHVAIGPQNDRGLQLAGVWA